MLLTTLSAVAPHTTAVADSKKSVGSPESTAAAGAGITLIIFTVVQVIFGFLFGVAAAKLSYDRFASIGWAILAFFFSEIYVVYYAFFVSKPFIGAGRRR